MEYKNMQLNMPVLKNPKKDWFILKAESINRPCKITDLGLKWKAFNWSDAYVAETIGYKGYDKFLQNYPEPIHRYSPGKYLSDIPLWNCKLNEDYEVPHLFEDAECQPDQWRWLFWGPPEVGTNIHQDVDHSCAWNIVLKGYKYWWFWYNGELLNTVQGPGEIVFAPKDTWHGVRNLTTSLSITHNYKRKGKKSWWGTWFY